MVQRSTLLRALTIVLVTMLSMGTLAAPTQAASSKPSISSISPAKGPTSGGTKVSIKGKNFTKSSMVYFGDVKAKKVAYKSSKHLIATSPKIALSPSVDVNITVKTSKGKSNKKKYAYKALPITYDITPHFGPASGGTKVTVNGRHFTTTSKVTFGNSKSPKVTYVSSTKLIAVVPKRSAATTHVRVHTQYGTSTTNGDDTRFTTTITPAITSISPAKGPTSGGTKVTIRGSNFTKSSVVHFGDAKASVKYESKTKLVATSPAIALSPSVDVDVKVTNGNEPSNTKPYAYKALPITDDISPHYGSKIGGTEVTVNGRHFTTTSKVTFGNSKSPKVTYVSSTKLIAVVPKRSAATTHVRVHTQYGTSTTNGDNTRFTTENLAISTLSPAKGPTSGGTRVSIAGTGFTPDAQVWFGSVKIPTTFVSAHELAVTTPAVALSPSVDVAVKVTGASGTTKSLTYAYKALPITTDISPHVGPTTGGTEVTINGKHFTTTSTVTFGNYKSPKVTYVSSKQLIAVLPARSAATVHVRVQTQYGESTTNGDHTRFTTVDPNTTLNIGSFNIRVASGYHTSRMNLERPWPERGPKVAQQIEQAELDVVAIQEASASKKYTITTKNPQFIDLINLLGSPYKLTNTARYCTKPDKSGRCANGAGSATRIVYNSDRLKMLDEGSRKLDDRDLTSGSARHMAWARFEDMATGKKFFFVDVHLEPNQGALKGAIRAQQAAIVLDEIKTQNPEGLPTIVAGDMSATKFDKDNPPNIAHDTIVDAGFIDPLVNTFKYKGLPIVPKWINTQYSSLNNFEATPQTLDGYDNIASYIDYILLRGDFRMHEWETVVDLDETTGMFNGVIPSDHNLITLSVSLN